MPISLRSKVNNLGYKGLLTPMEVKRIRDALDKQQCKTVIDNEEERWFMCPTCKDYVIPYRKGKAHHCKCGQALSWEGVDDK